MADETRYSRRKFIGAAGATATTLAIAGCTEQNPTDGSDGGDGGSGGDGELSGTIDISGSSTVYPLCVAVSEQFRKDHSGVDINVRSTGSGGGFANYFCPGDTAFNNASRPIKSEEEEDCTSNGVTPVELNVATDAVTVIVNNEADWVDSITVDELKQIWKPNGATKWSDVRSEWPDEEFELYGAASTSGTFDYFTEVIVGESGSSRQDYQATEDDNSIVTGVSGSTYAMGYLGYAYYSENTDKVKALAIDDGDGEPVEPSLENAKSGKYKPLSRPLFTYAAKEELAREEVAEFARFYIEQSANRDLVADRVGYVPNTEEDMQAELDKLNSAIEEAQGN
ncbi:PstS family phosphate ABC transporter substrate-binding protein [Halorarius litoreus]|uniref:PstS family phosphate ABC transporter substrate-binding protein n=1 Tax=Halorarius litoreus TaxID=2962676 RepID=UPI0020CD1ABE|nr:PstS family phosphate ABC transporter substrate-binding protein [Halorarius litoreus]